MVLDNKALLNSKEMSKPLFGDVSGDPIADDFMQNLDFGEMSPNFGAEAAAGNLLNQYGNLAEVSRKVFEDKIFDIDNILDVEGADEGADRQPGRPNRNKEEQRKMKQERQLLGNDVKLNERSNASKHIMKESTNPLAITELNRRMRELRLDFRREAIGAHNPVEALLSDPYKQP